MLFDLRGKRKRVVQVIYAGLALMFAVTFVGFGIGSDAAGGIFDALGLGSGDTGPSNPQYESQIEAAEQALAEDPKDQGALRELADTNALAGDDELDVDEATGAPILTNEAATFYGEATGAWERYLDLDPKRPDAGIAARMVGVYILLVQTATDPNEIQDRLDSAVATAAVVAEDQPSANSYGTLAELAYLAGDTERADEAAGLAIEESEPSERKQTEQFVSDAKERGEKLQKQLAEQEELAQTTPEGAFQNPLEDSSPTGGLLP